MLTEKLFAPFETGESLPLLLAGSIIALTWLLVYYRNSALGAPVRVASGTIRCDYCYPIVGHLFHALQMARWNLDGLLNMANPADGKDISRSYHIPFMPPFIITNRPDCIEHVLKTKFESFEKSKFVGDRIGDVLGHGIFNADGHSWKVQRKTAANIFSVKNFRDFVGSVFVDEMTRLENKLSKAATSGSPVDMQDLFFRFTLDGFGKIGFGIDLHCMEVDEVPFAQAFDRCQSKIDYRFFSPFWKLEEYIFYWRRRELLQDIQTIRSFSQNIIKSREAESEEEKDTRADLLTYFMRLKGENGEKLSHELLGDYVLNFIIAGRDTTAQALSWTILLLSENPEVEAKLVQEIRETLNGRSPTYEEIKGMKYANAVFSETLRLHPSVPKNAKQAVKDEVLPDGVKVPKGCVVIWSPYVLGRTPSVWGPDAEKFKPERWLEQTKIPSQFEYPAFHAGPRTCLGKSLAELEGVFVLVSLLGRYKLKVVPGQTIRYGNSLTHPMDGPFLCTVEERTFDE